jgi:uroporphyrinogen III methyltransferase/synthase
MAERRGTVYLVGAGPGAADLITLRGAQCLRRADVVIYDSLVNPAILRYAPARAKKILAGKRAEAGLKIAQRDINRMLVEHARRGEIVVRLKGGDPFIFGRGGEEAQALARARIAFEVVPGITSAIAAPAYAGIPLTHRDHGSFVALVPGHEAQSKRAASPVPWKELARAARRGGTLVLMMATRGMSGAMARLGEAGLPHNTPAAAVQWGTTASQKTVLATLSTISAACEREGLAAPAVVVVGNCAALRERLKWAEAAPLFGRRIVVTRAGDDATDFARELRALGAEAIEFPVIEIAPPSSYAALDRAIGRLPRFDWIIFTSARGVDGFIGRLRTLGRDIRDMGAAAICAIGPATAERLRSYALRVAAVPREYRAEAIIPAIGERRVRGARILIPRAQVAREILPAQLRAHGARLVEVAPTYRTIRPRGGQIDWMRALAGAGAIDLVTFTSSSTAANFATMIGKRARGLNAAAIGPITAETARRCGFHVVVEPKLYTVASLLAAIRGHFAPPPRRRAQRTGAQGAGGYNLLKTSAGT